jgi:hypothetical protein
VVGVSTRERELYHFDTIILMGHAHEECVDITMYNSLIILTITFIIVSSSSTISSTRLLFTPVQTSYRLNTVTLKIPNRDCKIYFSLI